MKTLPNVLRNAIDKSITLSLPTSKFSLIWLHGLGDSPQGFYQYFLHPLSPLYQNFRIKLIAAPTRFVTIANQKCSSWYDITSTDRSKKESELYNLSHVDESIQIIDKSVQDEVEYWKQRPTEVYFNHRIVIGGFSQGAAMALRYGLECPNPLAGIIGYSGYLLPSTKLANLGKTNILINHGKQDEVVSFQYADKTYHNIKNDLRTKIQYIDRLDHTITLNQLNNMATWLKNLSSQMQTFYKSKY